MLIRILVCLLALPNAQAFEGISHEFSLAAWLAGSGRGLVASPSNQQNRVLLIPQRELRVELRPDYRVNYLANALVLRPRWLATESKTDEKSSSDATSRVEWSDAYFSLTMTDRLTVTYGLQNFQWGPAEATSPSNQIFRETVQMRDVLYAVKGRHLLRLNFSPGAGWTEVFMAELSDNGDEELISGASFERKALLKSELADAGGANYVGVVFGLRERSGGWLGEYFNYEFFDGLSLYADLSHERGSRAWYPKWSAPQMATALSDGRAAEERIYTFAATGLRYAFVSGSEVRAEWLYQEAGYSPSEINAAWSISVPATASQAAVYGVEAAKMRRLGLEFPGRQYLLFSMRVPEPCQVRDWIFYFRNLLSLQDGSSSVYLMSDFARGASGTILAALARTQGAPESELRGTIDYSVTLGYRHTW